MLAAGQVVAVRHELTRPLARGRDPATWLARDLETGRDVVLRFRSPGDVAGARLAEAVRHAALLAPVATFEADGAVVDVFDYLPGGEIGRLRGRGWPLSVRRLLPVVDALAQVHEAGWVHGDVKSANVLLDGDGLARLADFGSARRIGETAAAGASPYSVSPERLDGAAAAVADDVYALGVLLHELVSGHPPFYPDLTPERVRGEIPAPLTGRPTPPEPLRALVARCLAKAPADRPASMREVRTELDRCLALEESPATTTVPDQAYVPRPPVDAAPIRAQWQRTQGGGLGERELRRQGFRRGLLAGAALLLVAAFGFTFFVLPELVASRAPREASAGAGPPAPATVPAAPPDLSRLAEQKKLAEDRRQPLPERLQALERRDVEAWGGGEVAQARQHLADGDAAMEQRDYGVARRQFDALAGVLDVLEKRVPGVVTERLASAREAFDAGRSADAQARFASVLRVAPDHVGAQSGLARARVLDDVLRETSAGARAEQAGDATAALAAWRRALQLDPATAAAREGIARLEARAAGDAWSATLAQAQAALARRDYPAAKAAYEQAGRLRPGAPEVADGLAQVRGATETRALAAMIERATAAEREERWSQALAFYREALATEPALSAAQAGIERAEPRAMLDAELQSYLERSERLFSPAGRDVARNILGRAAAVPAPGPRLKSQVERLQQLITQAETPIRIALASDNVTEVQIYRIGKLGLFEQKDLELMPGRYTVVGTRQGYRDVRKELNLLPGSPPPTLVVRCEERI